MTQSNDKIIEPIITNADCFLFIEIIKLTTRGHVSDLRLFEAFF
jgi:hypothetical protein